MWRIMWTPPKIKATLPGQVILGISQQIVFSDNVGKGPGWTGRIWRVTYAGQWQKSYKTKHIFSLAVMFRSIWINNTVVKLNLVLSTPIVIVCFATILWYFSFKLMFFLCVRHIWLKASFQFDLHKFLSNPSIESYKLHSKFQIFLVDFFLILDVFLKTVFKLYSFKSVFIL